MTNIDRSFFDSTDVIDWKHPAVLAQAHVLAGDDDVETARNCFEFVRDEIKHSWDYKMNPVTWTASDVLRYGTGYCYAKSHLLAALLRGNDIASGLCYQRLTNDAPGSGFCLHGLTAVYLPEYGWYRIDARGNKANVDAQFTPPVERLAYPVLQPGEADLPGIYASPMVKVIAALQTYETWDELAANLPDVTM